MKNFFLVLFICIISIINSQEEKRLALVIGNANYDKGALKNPVNDALLIARTLDSLNFEVILDTNIEDKSDFIDVVMKFGNIREQYDVAFVYYAGHGIQVGSQNYLLPTKVDFKKETDVRMKAMAVQDIIMFLTAMTDQVNVLILDACRDNPFESNWDATRSLKGSGSGLAKMQAPSGSMIAFSTTAGNTAPDGNGENSVYCKVLAKNMLLEGVNLDQVFRNTRAEVLKESGGEQRTEESTQLTGETFYLVQNTFTDELKQIDALIEEENYTEALVLAGHIVELSPKNKIAHYKKARVYSYLEKNKSALHSLDKAYELDSNYVKIYNLRGIIYVEQKKYDLAIKEYERGIALKEIDPEGAAYCYRFRAEQYERLREYDKALADYDSAIVLQPENADRYYNRALFYYEQKEYNKSIVDFTRATELDPDDSENWRMLGYVYKNGIKDYEKALDYYEKSLEVDSTYVLSINNKANIYVEQKKYDLAIKEYERGIALKEIDPEGAAFCYINRATQFERLREYDKALADYDSAIALEPENAFRYISRAWFHFKIMQNLGEAENDYNKAIAVEKNDEVFYNKRARFYMQTGQNQKALKDYNKAIELDNEQINGYNSRGFYYYLTGDSLKAIKDYNVVLNKDTNDTDIYFGMAYIYEKQNKFEDAKKMYDLAITKDLDDPQGYYHLAKFYHTKNSLFKALRKFDKAIDKLKGVGDYSIYNKKGLEVYEYEIHLELYEIYKNDFEDLEEACDELQKAKSSFEEDIDALIYHPDALSEIEALIKSNCQR